MIVHIVETSEGIIGVYADECKKLAEEKAEEWLNESAGNNMWTGSSIGRRRDFGRKAKVKSFTVIT